MKIKIIWSAKPTAKLRRMAEKAAQKHFWGQDPPGWVVCGDFLLVREDLLAESIEISV